MSLLGARTQRLGLALVASCAMGGALALPSSASHDDPIFFCGSAGAAEQSGTPGPDTLTGTSGADRLDGLEGDDVLRGLAGPDCLLGDDGNDTLDGGAGPDDLNGYQGADRLSGGTQVDELDGGEGKDSLDGGAGNDRLQGAEEADHLVGGSGADTMYGDFMDPTTPRAGSDTLVGGAGNDRMAGGGQADSLGGGTGADRLEGDGGADTLRGGAGDDRLYGDNANVDDLLSRANGNPDELRDLRGDGADRLVGGSGDDTIGTGTGAGNTVDAGPGNDHVLAVNGKRDGIDCGSGRDVAHVDASDRVRGCESVDRAISPLPSVAPRAGGRHTSFRVRFRTLVETSGATPGQKLGNGEERYVVKVNGPAGCGQRRYEVNRALRARGTVRLSLAAGRGWCGGEWRGKLVLDEYECLGEEDNSSCDLSRTPIGDFRFHVG